MFDQFQSNLPFYHHLFIDRSQRMPIEKPSSPVKYRVDSLPFPRLYSRASTWYRAISTNYPVVIALPIMKDIALHKYYRASGYGLNSLVRNADRLGLSRVRQGLRFFMNSVLRVSDIPISHHRLLSQTFLQFERLLRSGDFCYVYLCSDCSRLFDCSEFSTEWF